MFFSFADSFRLNELLIAVFANQISGGKRRSERNDLHRSFQTITCSDGNYWHISFKSVSHNYGANQRNVWYSKGSQGYSVTEEWNVRSIKKNHVSRWFSSGFFFFFDLLIKWSRIKYKYVIVCQQLCLMYKYPNTNYLIIYTMSVVDNVWKTGWLGGCSAQ